ncbi:hypothetical protein DIPPA_12247 [Diplonema papillatum]|nr:hypothetical protein DIPPA_12247 [Diplonema papillatum]
MGACGSAEKKQNPKENDRPKCKPEKEVERKTAEDENDADATAPPVAPPVRSPGGTGETARLRKELEDIGERELNANIIDSFREPAKPVDL